MQCILLYYNSSIVIVTILIKHNAFAKFYKRRSFFLPTHALLQYLKKHPTYKVVSKIIKKLT